MLKQQPTDLTCFAHSGSQNLDFSQVEKSTRHICNNIFKRFFNLILYKEEIKKISYACPEFIVWNEKPNILLCAVVTTACFDATNCRWPFVGLGFSLHFLLVEELKPWVTLCFDLIWIVDYVLVENNKKRTRKHYATSCFLVCCKFLEVSPAPF